MLRRLFQVVDRSTNRPLAKGEFFENKQAAKAVRDQFTNAKVILGPDHWRYDEKVNRSGHES